MTATLHLPLKAVYFDQIRDGAKREEFRLVTPYWRKRLEGRTYDRIVLTLGYPKGSGIVCKPCRAQRDRTRHEVE